MKEYPIDGQLDLHTFQPSDVGDLVPEYLRACHEKGLTEVRIIHGKGTGTLRRHVRSILDEHPLVASFHKATDASNWGATIAHLTPPHEPDATD
jgi:DNA-nicking Smr family endonuclease